MAAGSRIEVWSGLRDDGEAANTFNADLLHFDIVLCAAIIIAFPIAGRVRKLITIASTLGALFAFHAIALLVTVENTYSNVLAEVARRNYSPLESSIYLWLYQLFAHIGIQLLPAAVLGFLVVRHGGIGGAVARLHAPETEPGLAPIDAPTDGGLKPEDALHAGRRSRAAFIAVVIGAVAIAGAGLAMHFGKVRGRQAEAACMRGFKKLVAGSPDEAAVLFARALALRPAFIEALDGRGNALYAGRHLEGSAESYRDALRLDPEYFPSRLGLATTLDALGRTDEAIVEYEAASAADPGRWEPHFNRALALRKLNKAVEAEAGLRRAIEVNPSVAEVRLELAKLLITTGRLCEAVPHLEAFLRLQPESKHAELVRSSIATARGECGGK